ncbi:uncharacterized protein BDW43DRAFT_258617 [Aspergillus alliaceus]|uniref:uncharacterized protein n=1 Tax=Petromyces alliaceus TaxID=209559 RepID=UPI0012A400E0|nr:uncharacterized protein BDW43DRAFT_258617 [Aspergillus alliaceus]KAB8239598.1 hypothetical protein BDW43DRAFT_258617 [Aspergillus alliaceus]
MRNRGCLGLLLQTKVCFVFLFVVALCGTPSAAYRRIRRKQVVRCWHDNGSYYVLGSSGKKSIGVDMEQV